MAPGVTRSLTANERAALSEGLWDALMAAGAFPRIAAASSPLARLSHAWRGHTPVLTLGDRIFWGRAPDDCSRQPAAMALLQHELQHVLDFATGRMSWLSYALHPRDWTYNVPDTGWDWNRLGAEQRAVLAERLWRAEHKGAGEEAARLRAVLPWAG